MKPQKLTPQQVNEILNNPIHKDKSLSVGFRRLTALPSYMVQRLDLNLLLTTGDTDTHKVKVKFFEEMTPEEYKTYLITH